MIHLSLALLFSILGFIAGIAALIFLFTTFRRGPEALKGAIFEFILGISLMVVAFLWDLLFSLQIFGFTVPFSLDLHHLLLAMSIIFFVRAAQKFCSLWK